LSDASRLPLGNSICLPTPRRQYLEHLINQLDPTLDTPRSLERRLDQREEMSAENMRLVNLTDRSNVRIESYQFRDSPLEALRQE
jgi:hypothetical protein